MGRAKTGWATARPKPKPHPLDTRVRVYTPLLATLPVAHKDRPIIECCQTCYNKGHFFKCKLANPNFCPITCFCYGSCTIEQKFAIFWILCVCQVTLKNGLYCNIV